MWICHSQSPSLSPPPLFPQHGFLYLKFVSWPRQPWTHTSVLWRLGGRYVKNQEHWLMQNSIWHLGTSKCSLNMALIESNLNDKVSHLVTTMDWTPRAFRVQCLLEREYRIGDEHGVYLALSVKKGSTNRVLSRVCVTRKHLNVRELHITLLSEIVSISSE